MLIHTTHSLTQSIYNSIVYIDAGWKKIIFFVDEEIEREVPKTKRNER